MALGRQGDRQSELLVTWAEMPRSPGHVFYDRLQSELLSAGFDSFVEGQCAAYYATRQGRPSLPPGRYFRMLLVGSVIAALVSLLLHQRFGPTWVYTLCVTLACWSLIRGGLQLALRVVGQGRPGWPPMPWTVTVVLVGTALYCTADEWLTRGPGARRGLYALTKLLFVLSLVLAIALNPARLFFLIIIVPVILLFLIVYGLFSSWAYRRTRQPMAGAAAVALAFAWAIAAVFPVIR